MVIQNKIFPDGELVIYVDYSVSERAGAGGCFQIFDICIDENISILSDLKIDIGFHYNHINDVLQDLEIIPGTVNVRQEIVELKSHSFEM